MLHLLQTVAPVAADSLARVVANGPQTWQGAVQLFAMSVVVGLASVIQHLVAKPGRAESANALTELKTSIAELRAFIVGPDGENGLRGEVRELKDDVKGILERERVRPTPYDRRSS